jgi:hypothetical protein
MTTSMGETLAHVNGVVALERHVRALAGARHDLILYRDCAGIDAQRKPPLVGGFRPDLFARTWSDGRFYIGEAKTTRDLETAHSAAQIAAFVDAISADDYGRLIVCVPFGIVPAARGLLDLIVGGRDEVHDRIDFIATEMFVSSFAAAEAS